MTTIYMSNTKTKKNILESARFISGNKAVVYECTRTLRGGNTEKIYLVSAGTIANLFKDDVATYTTVGNIQYGSSNKLRVNNIFEVNNDIIVGVANIMNMNEVQKLPLWVAR